MNKKFKLLSVLLALIIVSSCVASFHAVSIYTDGDYSYADVDADHVALYDYTGGSSVLVVPEYFSGRIVSEIYSYAFEENQSITVIDFSENPNYINYIGTKAFAECTGLTGNLSLPSSLRSMGYAAFQGCTGLRSLTVNVGVRVIPEQCFNRCSGLGVVYLPSELESIERLAFGNCSDLDKVYIPSSVTYINEYAFTNSNPTLYVYNNSYAHQFAIDYNYMYVVIDPPQPEPTETPTEEPTEEPTTAPTEPVTEAPTEPITPTQAPTQEPTAEPTQQPTEAAGYLLGDVDNNGVVDVFDVTLTQRHLAHMIIQTECDFSHADVNGDDLITVDDTTFIIRFLCSMNVKYPIGKFVQE